MPTRKKARGTRAEIAYSPFIDHLFQAFRISADKGPNPLGGVARVLDFGCGASHFHEYLLSRGVKDINYSGLDLSAKFIALSKSKFPSNAYYCLDLLEDSADLPVFDYIVLNGVFTEKRSLTFEEMFSYFKELVQKVFEHAQIGIAFNVMSKHVEELCRAQVSQPIHL